MAESGKSTSVDGCLHGKLLRSGSRVNGKRMQNADFRMQNENLSIYESEVRFCLPFRNLHSAFCLLFSAFCLRLTHI
jgi:hypothetical protein